MLSFLQRKWAWACENPLFWANCALLLTTLAFVLKAGPSDFWLKVWSWVLQIIGAVTVWHDLIGAANEFGAAGIIQRNWDWIRRGFGKIRIVSVGANLRGSSSVSAVATGTLTSLDPNASLEDRVARIEASILQLDKAASQTVALVESTKRELRKDIHQVRADLEHSVVLTNNRLKDAMIGNYPVLLFGAIWVAIGTTLSTFSPEIAKAVTGEWGFLPQPFDTIDYLKLKYLVAR
jgi:hypothetical protein